MKAKFALALALCGLGQSAMAQTVAPPRCLNVKQAEALVTYLLPKAVDASRVKCSASLPATSPLMIQNSERLARYQAASETSWPQAKNAVKLLAGTNFPMEMDDALLRPIADALFTQLIGAEIKPKDCALIGKIYGDLAPMPSANLASLAVTVVQATAKEDRKQGIPICKIPA
jgi:hypothetical protein